MSNPNRTVQTYDVTPHRGVVVDSTIYPWINTAAAHVPTVAVALEDGTSFLYGSLIGLNNSIAKMADKVSGTDSESLQTTLFNGLPSVLMGRPHAGISRVENSQHLDTKLFVASRNLARLPGLVFAIESRVKNEEIPLVIRVGLGASSEHSRLLGLLGINALRNKRRNSS